MAVIVVPGVNEPRLNVTSEPDCVNEPCVVLAETKVKFGGRVFVRKIPLAVMAPIFVAARVNVTICPAATAAALPVAPTARSTPGMTAKLVETPV